MKAIYRGEINFPLLSGTFKNLTSSTYLTIFFSVKDLVLMMTDWMTVGALSYLSRSRANTNTALEIVVLYVRCFRNSENTLTSAA